LQGDPKMGKTHLVTKVFPVRAREFYRARCAVLDLRSRAQTIPDILYETCNLLCPSGDLARVFPAYFFSHQEWLNRPNTSESLVQSFLKMVKITEVGEVTESQKVANHLTKQFVSDLRRLDDTLSIIIFDQVDDTDETIRTWLMYTLLVQLSALEH